MPKVLIVEDELMIADLIEDVLTDEGYDVCGIARSVDDAVALGRTHHPDLAIIDVRLAGRRSGTEIPGEWFDLARIGILYATANPEEVMLSAVIGDACLTKPYMIADLVLSLKIVAALIAGSTPAVPLPRGLQLLPSPMRHLHALN
jgi:DNA-binding response OmpR family regulator